MIRTEYDGLGLCSMCNCAHSPNDECPINFIAGEGEEWREFYKGHRGGSNVVMCIVSEPGEQMPSRFAVFSSIDTAEKWANTLGDDRQVCFAPFIIDDPEFGNRPNN